MSHFDGLGGKEIWSNAWGRAWESKPTKKGLFFYK